MQKDDGVLQELYMLTGMVHKDINYLYYMLMKNGTMFKEDKPVQPTLAKNSVSTFEDWFEGL